MCCVSVLPPGRSLISRSSERAVSGSVHLPRLQLRGKQDPGDRSEGQRSVVSCRLERCSVCVSSCLSVHLFVYQSVCVCLPVCLTEAVCVCVFLHVAVCPLVCLLVYPSVCLPVHLSTCVSACLPACLPACLSACLSPCLPVCLSVCQLVCLSFPSVSVMSVCAPPGSEPLWFTFLFLPLASYDRAVMENSNWIKLPPLSLWR